MVHVEQQWAKSAHKIKNNLLDQCQVICPGTDFSEVGLDNIIIDGHIEVAPDEGDEAIRVLEFEHADPAADP